MLRKILSAAFRKRAPEPPPAAAPYTGPRNRRFVAFIADVEQPCFLGKSDRIEAYQASLRLRVWLPAREIMQFAPVCVVPLQHVERDPELAELGEAHAIVVSKFSVHRITSEPARFAALAAWVEKTATNRRVVADFCDDLSAAAIMFGRPEPAEFQRRLIRSCALTVSTAALREKLAPQAVHGAAVIEDPYERETADVPRFAPQHELRLAWFGVFGPPLMPFLQYHFGTIARRLAPRSMQIAFITNHSHAGLAREMGENLRRMNEKCELRFVPWSRAAVAVELARADLVLLPQDAASEWGRVKSHNRLVEALRAGRFAIASPIPSYLELSDYAWIGEPLADGVEWALAHPIDVLAKLHAGQNAVEQRFSPRKIGERWAATLDVFGKKV